jgi:hypothetical protein
MLVQCAVMGSAQAVKTVRTAQQTAPVTAGMESAQVERTATTAQQTVDAPQEGCVAIVEKFVGSQVGISAYRLLPVNIPSAAPPRLKHHLF